MLKKNVFFIASCLSCVILFASEEGHFDQKNTVNLKIENLGSLVASAENLDVQGSARSMPRHQQQSNVLTEEEKERILGIASRSTLNLGATPFYPSWLVAQPCSSAKTYFYRPSSLDELSLLEFEARKKGVSVQIERFKSDISCEE